MKSRGFLTGCAGLILTAGMIAAQPPPEVKVTVQLDKFAWYWEDDDPKTYGTVTQSLSPLPSTYFTPSVRNAIIADVVSVNDKPARGAFVSHGLRLVTGHSDLPRTHAHYFVLDIQTADGGQIGSLFGTLLTGGNPAPGAPTGGAGLWAVHGGSGAYLNLRGQGTNVGSSNLYSTSMKEDTAMRRTYSSGKLKLDFYLSGLSPSEIHKAFHAADGSPVTAANPARAGETLILEVKASWATRPPLAPGGVYSEEPLQTVAYPVEAAVDGQPAEVLNALGWPGARDHFRVDVRLVSAGAPESTLVLTTGHFLATAPFKLPVR
jgi:hypothetical protein